MFQYTKVTSVLLWLSFPDPSESSLPVGPTKPSGPYQTPSKKSRAGCPWGFNRTSFFLSSWAELLGCIAMLYPYTFDKLLKSSNLFLFDHVVWRQIVAWDPNIPSWFLILDPEIILCSGCVGAGRHPDHPDNPQQRHHQEPQDLPLKTWGKQMVGIQVEGIFLNV